MLVLLFGHGGNKTEPAYAARSGPAYVAKTDQLESAKAEEGKDKCEADSNLESADLFTKRH